MENVEVVHTRTRAEARDYSAFRTQLVMFPITTAITSMVSWIIQPPPETNKPSGLPKRMANTINDTAITGREITATRADQHPHANSAMTIAISSEKSTIHRI